MPRNIEPRATFDYSPPFKRLLGAIISEVKKPKPVDYSPAALLNERRLEGASATRLFVGIEGEQTSPYVIKDESGQETTLNRIAHVNIASCVDRKFHVLTLDGKVLLSDYSAQAPEAVAHVDEPLTDEAVEALALIVETGSLAV